MRIREVILVEGVYDKAALSGVVDGLVLTLGGFSVYRDPAKRALIREMGRKRGLILLTDSDAAGFQLRRYIRNIAQGIEVKNAYIPAVTGKESRKRAPSREGLLGVEGMSPEVLLAALRRAGATEESPRSGRGLTYTDLYELGISGTAGSAGIRRSLLSLIGLPARLSKKELLSVLGSLYTYEELAAILRGKPVLFWDFHGTLTLPKHEWFDALRANLPADVCRPDVLHEAVHHAVLPWWTMAGQKGPTGADFWHAAQAGYTVLLKRCGYAEKDVRRAVAGLRPAMIDPKDHVLYPDALSVLAELQRRGYRSILVSNNFPELRALTEQLGLAPYLSGVVCSGEIGYSKPDPRIFEAALDLAGRPSAAWMIGDNPQDDLAAALAAGLKAVGVHTGEKDCPAGAVRCETLTGLLGLFP